MHQQRWHVPEHHHQATQIEPAASGRCSPSAPFSTTTWLNPLSAKRLPLGEPARASVCSVIFGGYLWPHAAQMCCLSRSFQSMICGGKAHLQIRKPRFFASSASLNLSDLSASSSFLPASSDSSPLGSSSRTLLRISSAVLPAVKYV